jgi:hypothetical protein
MTQIDAMKLALEALKLLTDTEQTFGALDYGDNAITALENALAQPEQEPVAWICEGSSSDEKHAIDYWPKDLDAIPIGTMLYTHPPQRKPLTDEQMKKIWYAMQNIMGWYSFQEIARAIEAAHGIKENT